MNDNSRTAPILVTGGAGFIGAHLCKRLVAERYRTISLDNYSAGVRSNHVPGAEYREGHTKDIERHVPETPRLVYHLGEYSRVEQSFDDVRRVLDFNARGTAAVLEFCRTRNVKIVYAGSSTKFGDGGLGRDRSPYAWTKASNTELVRNYGAWYGLPHAVAYFYNVYGPGERAGKYGTVMEIFRAQRMRGEPLTIVSPGTQKRNFTHVDDIVDGLLLIGEKGEGDEFGLGSDESYSVLDIARMIGGDIVMLPPWRDNRMDSTLNTGKSQELGWRAKRKVADYIATF